VRLIGVFRNPETLAHGGTGLPRQPLYRVRFSQDSLWAAYTGPPQDTLDAELYENWLEARHERSPRRPRANHRA